MRLTPTKIPNVLDAFDQAENERSDAEGEDVEEEFEIGGRRPLGDDSTEDETESQTEEEEEEGASCGRQASCLYDYQPTQCRHKESSEKKTSSQGRWNSKTTAGCGEQTTGNC